MEGAEGNAGQPGPAERSHRSSVSSVGARDEPSLQFRRNVFFPRRRELQIHDEEVLRLLYEEAKGNVLTARYPCDLEDCEVLGGLVCRVQLGPYQPGQPAACTLREKLDSFLPAHLCKRGHGLFAAFRGRGAKTGPGEQGLLNAYRQVKEVTGNNSEREATLGSHYRAYLLKCHELPFYGMCCWACAFRSCRGITLPLRRKSLSCGWSSMVTVRARLSTSC